MTTLMRRNPMTNGLNNFFDDFFTKDLFSFNDRNFAENGNTLPSVNVREAEKEYDIEMAVPGMKKDDFKINLERNILTISSETRSEREEKDAERNYNRREFNYRSFSRSFTMPSDVVDMEHIEANYLDGILHIKVPKKETVAQQIKTIEVH